MKDEIYLKKEMDVWGGVTMYRLLQAHLSDKSPSPEVVEGYGSRLLPIVTQWFDGIWSQSREEAVAMGRKLRGFLDSKSPQDLKDWVLGQIKGADWQALFNDIRLHLHLWERCGVVLDPLSKAIMGWNGEVGGGVLCSYFRQRVESMTLEQWEVVLNAAKEIAEAVLPAEGVTKALPVGEACHYFSFYLDGVMAGMVVKHPHVSSRTVCEANEGLVLLMENHRGWGGDPEEAYRLFWEQGIRGGSKGVPWPKIMQLSIDEPLHEGIQNALYRVVIALEDYISRNSLVNSLVLGRNGKLSFLLKKATFRDLLDERKRRRAAKRIADEQAVLDSDLCLSKSTGEEVSGESVLERLVEAGSDEGFQAVETGITIEKLEAIVQESPRFTPREREALALRISGVREDQCMLTYEELGHRMGVSKGTAKKLWDRGSIKLVKEYNS